MISTQNMYRTLSPGEERRGEERRGEERRGEGFWEVLADIIPSWTLAAGPGTRGGFECTGLQSAARVKRVRVVPSQNFIVSQQYDRNILTLLTLKTQCLQWKQVKCNLFDTFLFLSGIHMVMHF